MYLRWFAFESFMASQFWKYTDGKSPMNSLSERSMMHNLGNLKLACQFPIAPWNLLDLKIRTCSCGRAPSQKGKISSIWLFPRTRYSNIMQLANNLGIWLWNWFSPKAITLKLFGTVHVWGMGPSRLLFLRSSTEISSSWPNIEESLIEAKICALMAHILYNLCTKRHSNHPTWPKSMLRP